MSAGAEGPGIIYILVTERCPGHEGCYTMYRMTRCGEERLDGVPMPKWIIFDQDLAAKTSPVSAKMEDYDC